MTVIADIRDDFEPHLVAQLRESVLAAELEDDGACYVASFNVGGWKSQYGFLDRNLPGCRELDAALRRELAGTGYTFNSWAMVSRVGAVHKRHHHASATLSGIYYVDAGIDPWELGSPTVFEDPPGPDVVVLPRPARLVRYSGLAWHHVPIVAATRERITIAFDVFNGTR